MFKTVKKPRILMIGPGRTVMGGITTVVNSYFQLGLDKKTKLTYLSTMKDGSKIKKLCIAVLAYIRFCFVVSKYDIVHIHMAAQASFYRKAIFVKLAKQAGKKVVIHQHAADFDDFFNKQCNDVQREKIKDVFNMADRVLVLSNTWSEFFGQHVCDKDKLVVLCNGAIVPNYVKTDYSDKGVLFLGRLGKRKGTYDLLKAIPEILKVVPDAMFYLGGDGDVEQCHKIAEEQGFLDNVKFLGWIRGKEKEKYFKQCSIYILPSYHEGMPMSVLEAMSYGLATVSTNAGGIPQIINNCEDGIRIEAGDVDAIVNTLVSLLNDPEQKKKIGKQGRRRVESCFNVTENIDKLCEIYQVVL